MFNKQIDAVIRHGLSGFGAFLLTIGAQPEAVESFLGSTATVLSGVASFGLALGWSLLEKQLRR
jgi:hypothetical protein